MNFIDEALQLYTSEKPSNFPSTIPNSLVDAEYPKIEKEKINTLVGLISSASKIETSYEEILGKEVKGVSISYNLMESLNDEQINYLSVIILRSAVAVLGKMSGSTNVEEINSIIGLLDALLITKNKSIASNFAILIISRLSEKQKITHHLENIVYFIEYGYFTDSLSSVIPYFPIFLSKVFALLSSAEFEDKATQLATCLKHISDSIPEGSVKMIDEIFIALTQFLIKEKDENETFSISTEFCNLFTKLTIIKAPTKKVVAHLFKVLRVQKKETNDTTFQYLISCLAGQNIEPQNNGSFVIKNSVFLSPLIEYFKDDKSFVQLLTILITLCDYSIDNTIMMGQGKVDVTLLEFINQNKMETDFIANPGVGFAISLIEKIISVISTPSTVQSFLRLLSPVQGAFLSKLHPAFISSLDEILGRGVISPVTFFKSSDISVITEGLSAQALNQSFSIGMWIYIPGGYSEKAKIFELKDSNGIGYEMMINDSEISITLTQQGNRTCTHQLGIQLQKNEWIPLSILFIQNKKLSIKAAVKGRLSQPVESQLTFPKNASIIFRVGGSEKSVNPIRIGTFCITSEISEESVISFAANGPRTQPKNIIVNFTGLHMLGNRLRAVICKHNVLIETKIEGNTSAHRGFLDVLLEFTGIKVILPLYRWLDYMFVDNEEVPSFAVSITNVIASLLLSSVTAQHNFSKSDGFILLSRTLSNLKAKHLTYMLYTKLFNLYEQMADKDARISLLRHGIINPEIWSHSIFEEQDRILKHWGRVLYAEAIEESMEARSFSDLLSLLRIFYWYTPIEEDIKTCGPGDENPRHPISDQQISGLRGNITAALFLIAQKKFTAEDFEFLMGNIVTLQDTHQMVDLLKLVKLIAVSEDMPLKQVEGRWELFNCLHHIINRDDNDVVLNVIDLFATLHLVKYMSYPKDIVHANILMNLVPPTFLTMDMVRFMIPFVERFPEFQSLLFNMLLTMNDADARAVTMRHLKPNPLFATRRHWVLWPIVCALSSPPDFQRFAMSLVARSSNENWSFTYGAIDLLSRSLGVDGSEAKMHFLNELCKHLLESPLMNHDKQNEFLDLANFHIFFRRESDTDLFEYLHNLYADSPFNDSKSERVVPMETMNGKPVDRFGLYKQIEKAKEETYKVRFGLRFDAEGRWKDAELAINVIKQLRRVSVKSFHNTAAILASFAARCEGDIQKEALEQIDALTGAKIIDRPYLLLMQQADPRFKEAQAPSDSIELFIAQQLQYNNGVIESFNATAEKFLKFRTKCEEHMLKIFELQDDELFSKSSKIIKYVNITLNADKSRSKKELSHLWRRVSSKGGPYYNETQSLKEIQRQRYRLSRKLYNGVPSKVTVDKGKEISLKEAINTDSYYKGSRRNYKSALDNKFLRASPQDVTNMISEIELPNESSIIELPAYLRMLERVDEVLLTLMKEEFTLQLAGHEAITFSASNVTKVMFRPIRHVPTGLEVFTADGRSYLIELVNFNSLNVLKYIKKLPGFKRIEVMDAMPEEYAERLKIQDRWARREISTFDYLLRLNDISGRSFHSAEFYPVMPKVIGGDFSSERGALSLRSVARLLGHVSPFSRIACDLNGGFEDSESVKDIAKTETDLTPEFYSAPYVIRKESLHLGAKSAQEFILKHREILESEETAQSIPAWVDRTFGSKQYPQILGANSWTPELLTDSEMRASLEADMAFLGSHPSRVFRAPHRRREPLRGGRFDGKAVETRMAEAGIFGLVQDDHIDEALIGLAGVTEDGKVKRIAVAERADGSLFCGVKDVLEFDEVATCFGGSDRVFVAGTESGSLVVSREGEQPIKIQSAHSGAVKHLSIDSRTIVSSGGDNRITIRDTSGFKRLLSIPSYRGASTAVAVCSEFHCAAVACEDGTTAVVSLTSGDIVRTFENRGVASMLLITPVWGSVVAFAPSVAGGVITVRSAYADLEATSHMDFKIEHWCAASKDDGRDIVLAATKRNRVIAFEPACPGEQRVIWESDEPILGLFFSKVSLSAVIATESGKLIMASI